MSELYRTSETSDAQSAADIPAPARGDGDTRQRDLTRYEEALEDANCTRYDDGGTLAAEEEGLPTRQEAWQQT